MRLGLWPSVLAVEYTQRLCLEGADVCPHCKIIGVMIPSPLKVHLWTGEMAQQAMVSTTQLDDLR